jgi:hypothetical protein
MVLLVLLLAVVVIGFAGAMWMTRLPGRSHAGELPPPGETERDLEARLRAHVEMLAGEIGERHVWRPRALEAAALYIAETLQGLGYEARFEEFEADSLIVRNVVAELPGRERPQEVLVLGAHYDTVRGSPGADDNGSGVAALL